MDHKELVSVIIPTYNRAHTIGAAIQSVIRQSYPYVQLIVVDDGSTDHTAQVMKNFPSVRYIVQMHQGQAAARNTGLSWSKGTYIATLDSDDVWESGFLSTCVQKLETDGLDFVFSNWYQDDGEGGWRDFMVPNPFMAPFLCRAVNKWVLLQGHELRNLYLKICPSPSSSTVIRRSSLISGWNEQIHIGDDWCLYLDMILNKDCRIAFTLQKLWKKGVEPTGVFEGREPAQLLQLLYIDDFNHFISRYRNLLNPQELTILEKKYMESLIALAKYSIIHKFDLLQASKLMKRSFETDGYFTLKMIPLTFASGLLSRFNGIF